MVALISKPNTEEKLKILSQDAQYDLACACGTGPEDTRHRGSEGKWIYPVSLPNGGKSVLFKTLASNHCSNDCKYCPLRAKMDVRRCTLSPDETANVFLDYLQQKKVFGLFLTSGVIGTPEKTMQQLNDTAAILRNKHKFRGFIHLKIIPGASNAAITESVSLASAVSLNIETPGAKYLKEVSDKKDYIKDIIEPMKLIQRLTAPGSKYSRVKQTTQFIVGAAGEPDSDIIKYSWGLYSRLKLERIYFSAYQKGTGETTLPGEQKQLDPAAVFTREHRLYQADFLMRKYNFEENDFYFNEQGQLPLNVDPKTNWALKHPECFPVNLNKATKQQLLRVPGLGPLTVNRILKHRKESKLHSLTGLTKPYYLQQAHDYVCY